MDLETLIAELQKVYDDKGNMSLRVDAIALGGRFTKISHVNIAHMRDGGEAVPVIFLNLVGEGVTDG